MVQSSGGVGVGGMRHASSGRGEGWVTALEGVDGAVEAVGSAGGVTQSAAQRERSHVQKSR